jgi:hypothetical protein
VASFAIYAGAVIWVFAVRSALKAWAGLIIVAVALLPAGVVCFLTKGRRVNTDNDVRVAGPGIRQSMSSLHTWAGLLLGWVLYAMFLTWHSVLFQGRTRNGCGRSCRVYHRNSRSGRGGTAGRRRTAILQPVPRVGIRLPDERNNSAYAFWRTSPAQPGPAASVRATDPDRPAVTSRDTLGGEFFYRYFQFHYMPVVWGRWLAGAAAMFMLVAIVSGVITHKRSSLISSPFAGKETALVGWTRTTPCRCLVCRFIS